LIWVFYSLLLGNGLFIAWHWLDSESESAELVVEVPKDNTVKELRLLSEVDPRVLRPRVHAGGQAAEVKADPSRSQQINYTSARSSSAAPFCYRLGPVATDEQLEQVRTWVIAAGGAPQLRLGERQEFALYWVYLPPFSTHTEAVRVSQEMARSGIKDIFVIPRGDMAHAISLGVYARDSSLQRRLQQLKAKGFDASVLPRYRVALVSWIDAKFTRPRDFEQQRFQARFPELQAIATSCEKVLSDEHRAP
jgi:hypothetical protein